MKILAYLADLTQTAQAISAPTPSLGISVVAAYAQQELRSDLEFGLFKFSADLDRALRERTPEMST